MKTVTESNRQYYDATSEQYDLKHNISVSDLRDFISDLRELHIKEVEGKEVLDCGCGTGRGAIKFALMKSRVTAIDISERIVEICRENSKRLGLDINVKACDLTDLPFEDETFDIVTTSAALHHVPDVVKALREFRRILKSGGKVVLIAEPKEAWIRPAWMRDIKDRLSNRFDERFGNIASDNINPDVHIFRIEELRELLAADGFVNIRSRTFSCVSSLYRDFLFYRLMDFRIRNGLQTMFNKIDRSLLRYLPGGMHALFNLSAEKGAKEP